MGWLIFAAVWTFGTVCLSSLAAREVPDGVVSFETETFALSVSAGGETVAFEQRTGEDTGPNRLAPDFDRRFALLRTTKDGKPAPSVSLSRDGETLTVRFKAEDGSLLPQTARFRVAAAKRFLTLELLEVTGGDWYSLEFGRAKVAINYADPKETLGATTISMAVGSIPDAMPGQSTQLGGRTYRVTAERGAKIALIAAPISELRDAMKEAVSAITDPAMPVSKAGGPWAMDIPKGRGNYIITSSAITAETVPAWIDHLGKFGIDQVDFHQGGAFRQGDFAFKPEAYPKGVADFREMSDRLRENGMIAGLHTYAEFLNPQSCYVTPVPHPDLDAMAEFTLSADLDAESKSLFVDESTADVSTVTGFFVRNSLYLRIGDELVRFGKPSKDSPFGFAECERGALGTKATSHAKGAKVEQMTHLFGLFAPKVGSELFLEIARRTAQTYNEGGFSMIYLDALDGTGATVADKELVWFYDTLFVGEIVKNCVDPPLMEYSTMNANIWLCRSRMGAWDCAHKGFRRFFDLHVASNRVSADAAFLPGQFGWLAISPAGGDELPGFQRHPIFTEDIHYLGAKLLGNRYGYSILDIPLEGTTPAAERNGAILKRYRDFGREGNPSAETLEKCRDPNRDFVLLSADGEKPAVLREACLGRFKLDADHSTAEFENRFAEQVPYLRIENRWSVDENSPDAIPLIELEENAPGKHLTTAKFDPPLDLSKNLGMGLWIFGDGGGQKINVRVESSPHLVSGHNDHFVTVDFTGWRFIPLVEAENGLEPMETWPVPCGGNYAEFREKVHYQSVTAVHLQVVGDAEKLRFRTLKAFPVRGEPLVNPSLEIAGKTVAFRGEIPAGSFLEFDPVERSAKPRVLDPSGKILSEPELVGEWPKIPAGKSTVAFQEDGRVKVVLRTLD